AAALAWFPFAPRLPAALTLTVLDVGQGDALFVTFPGGKTLLVDAGPKLFSGFNAGREVVAPYLWSLGLRHLDAVLLTHGHMDHMGGMPYILRHFTPGALWVTHSLPSEAKVQDLLILARRLGIPIRRRYQGERFRVGSAELDVLWPPYSYHTAAHARNRDSMVIRISDGREAMLLEGDAEAQGERGMLASGMPLESEVLKVGHHGSRTSSIPAFLAAVHPAAALISVGAGNTYGLPDGIVLRDLAAAGAHTFRTDRRGAVEAQFTAGQLRVFRFQPPGG
ncbi:MAG: ComEC/Rec2 family competence protein, partial [Terriglobales bacterium]